MAMMIPKNRLISGTIPRVLFDGLAFTPSLSCRWPGQIIFSANYCSCSFRLVCGTPLSASIVRRGETCAKRNRKTWLGRGLLVGRGGMRFPDSGLASEDVRGTSNTPSAAVHRHRAIDTVGSHALPGPDSPPVPGFPPPRFPPPVSSPGCLLSAERPAAGDTSGTAAFGNDRRAVEGQFACKFAFEMHNCNAE
jgi:hypothetical protein